MRNEGKNESRNSDYLLNIISDQETEIDEIHSEFKKYLNDKPSSIDNDLNSGNSFDKIIKKFHCVEKIN